MTSSLILSVLLAGASVSALAADDIGRTLAPCIDENTQAIMRIDLTRVDVDAFYATALEIMRQGSKTASSPADEAQILAQKENFKQWRSRFTAAGGRSVYALWNSADPTGLLVAVPITSGADAAALAEQVAEAATNWGDRVRQVRKGNLILVGLESSLNRWQQASPTTKPSIDRAAAAAPQGTVQLFLVPSTDTRRVVEAMLPVISEQRVVPPADAVVKGLQWAVLAVDFPPAPSLKLHVESADNPSAQALNSLLTQCRESFSRIPEFKNIAPLLDKALEMLTPSVSGNTLELTLGEKECLDLISDSLVPIFAVAGEERDRIRCGMTLNGMGKAMLIYANDHADQLPPALQTLFEKAEYPASLLVCPAAKPQASQGSYVYRGIDIVSLSKPPALIVVHDRAGNHRDGRNVLFLDSHIEWVSEAEFAEYIERDNELRAKNNLQPKPAE